MYIPLICFGVIEELLKKRWHKPRKEEMAWVAGIFEGEGCVLITKGLHLRVTVTNTDMRLLGELKRICGGDITHGGITKKAKHVRRWRIENSKAFDFLRDIYPYTVGNKREEIALALEIEQTICKKGVRKLTEDIIAKRIKIRLGLQSMKKRGCEIAT